MNLKERATQHISLDRIARQADVGQGQLRIDLISPAYKEWAGGNAPAKQFYKVPIFFRSNSGMERYRSRRS
jgi:hypothetical protein